MREAAFTSAALLVAMSTLVRAAKLPPATGSGETDGACSITGSAAAQSAAADPTVVGVGIVLDEHLLTDGSRDQDYNGGGEVTFSGRHAGPAAWLGHALACLDLLTGRRVGFAGSAWTSSHAFAAGPLVFTPRDIAAQEVVGAEYTKA